MEAHVACGVVDPIQRHFERCCQERSFDGRTKQRVVRSSVVSCVALWRSDAAHARAAGERHERARHERAAEAAEERCRRWMSPRDVGERRNAAVEPMTEDGECSATAGGPVGM